MAWTDVSSPKATRSKQTSIGSSPSTGRSKPLAVAVEQNLVSVRMMALAKVNTAKLTIIEARQSRQAFQKVLHTISSSEKTTVFLRKEDRNEFMSRTKDRAPEARDKKPLASVSLVFRNGSESEELRDQFFKSLRQYAPLAIFPIENSLGMKFAPVGEIRFSIWQTSVKDFETSAKTT